MVGYAQYPHFNNDAIRHKDSVICLRIHNQEGAKDGKRSLRHLINIRHSYLFSLNNRLGAYLIK